MHTNVSDNRITMIDTGVSIALFLSYIQCADKPFVSGVFNREILSINSVNRIKE